MSVKRKGLGSIGFKMLLVLVALGAMSLGWAQSSTSIEGVELNLTPAFISGTNGSPVYPGFGHRKQEIPLGVSIASWNKNPDRPSGTPDTALLKVNRGTALATDSFVVGVGAWRGGFATMTQPFGGLCETGILFIEINGAQLPSDANNTVTITGTIDQTPRTSTLSTAQGLSSNHNACPVRHIVVRGEGTVNVVWRANFTKNVRLTTDIDGISEVLGNGVKTSHVSPALITVSSLTDFKVREPAVIRYAPPAAVTGMPGLEDRFSVPLILSHSGYYMTSTIGTANGLSGWGAGAGRTDGLAMDIVATPIRIQSGSLTNTYGPAIVVSSENLYFGANSGDPVGNFAGIICTTGGVSSAGIGFNAVEVSGAEVVIEPPATLHYTISSASGYGIYATDKVDRAPVVAAADEVRGAITITGRGDGSVGSANGRIKVSGFAGATYGAGFTSTGWANRTDTLWSQGRYIIDATGDVSIKGLILARPATIAIPAGLTNRHYSAIYAGQNAAGSGNPTVEIQDVKIYSGTGGATNATTANAGPFVGRYVQTYGEGSNITIKRGIFTPTSTSEPVSAGLEGGNVYGGHTTPGTGNITIEGTTIVTLATTGWAVFTAAGDVNLIATTGSSAVTDPVYIGAHAGTGATVGGIKTEQGNVVATAGQGTHGNVTVRVGPATGGVGSNGLAIYAQRNRNRTGIVNGVVPNADDFANGYGRVILRGTNLSTVRVSSAGEATALRGATAIEAEGSLYIIDSEVSTSALSFTAPVLVADSTIIIANSQSTRTRVATSGTAGQGIAIKGRFAASSGARVSPRSNAAGDTVFILGGTINGTVYSDAYVAVGHNWATPNYNMSDDVDGGVVDLSLNPFILNVRNTATRITADTTAIRGDSGIIIANREAKVIARLATANNQAQARAKGALETMGHLFIHKADTISSGISAAVQPLIATGKIGNIYIDTAIVLSTNNSTIISRGGNVRVGGKSLVSTSVAGDYAAIDVNASNEVVVKVEGVGRVTVTGQATGLSNAIKMSSANGKSRVIVGVDGSAVSPEEGPYVAALNGAAIKVRQAAKIQVHAGQITNTSAGTNAVIHNESVEPAEDGVVVRGGRIFTSANNAIAIRSTGGQGINVNGKELKVNDIDPVPCVSGTSCGASVEKSPLIEVTGTAGRAIWTDAGNVVIGGADEATNFSGVQITATGIAIATSMTPGRGDGHVTLHDIELNITGIGVLTSGGNVDLKPMGEKVVIRGTGPKGSGIGIQTVRPTVGVMPRPGIITIGSDKDETEIEVSSVASYAINAAGVVNLFKNAVVRVDTDTAIVADSIHMALCEIGGSWNKETGAMPRVSAAGHATSALAANAALGVSVRSMLMTAGTIVAGASDAMDPLKSRRVGIGVGSLPTTRRVASVKGVINIGAIDEDVIPVVQAFGAGRAMEVPDTLATIRIGTAQVVVGNGGYAISSNGDVFVGALGEDRPFPVVSAGKDGARTINATFVHTNPNVTRGVWVSSGLVSADTGSTAIFSAANVVDTIEGGMVRAQHNGFAVNASNAVRVTGGIVMVNVPEHGDTTARGTAIRTSGHITLNNKKDPEGVTFVQSPDMAIVSTYVQAGTSPVEQVTINGAVNLSGTVNAMAWVRAYDAQDLNTMRGLLSMNKIVNQGTTSEEVIGGILTIPAERTFQVMEDASIYVSDAGDSGDTLIVNGRITTTSDSRGTLLNEGYMIIGAGGDVDYALNRAESFANDGGTLVISRNSKLLGRTVTAFKAYADTFSTGARGTGTVIVPPMFDTSAASAWGRTATYVDTVYKLLVLNPAADEMAMMDPVFQNFEGARKMRYIGEMPKGYSDLNGDTSVYMDANGIIYAYFIEAAKRTFTVVAENEAGVTEKAYTLDIQRAVPVPGVQLATYSPEGRAHFRGVVEGAVQGVSTGDTAAFVEDITVGYTGSPIKVRVEYNKIADALFSESTYSGFGAPTVTYRGEPGTTAYNETTTPPSNTGVYEIRVSMGNGGRNFVGVPATEPILLGKLTIEPTNLYKLLGVDFMLDIEVPADTAINSFPYPLPDISRFSAVYLRDLADINTNGVSGLIPEVEDFTPYVDVANNNIVFSTLATSVKGAGVTFMVDAEAGLRRNIAESDNAFPVRITFVDSAGRYEAKPFVVINYFDETINGLDDTRPYTVKAGGEEITMTKGRNLDIVNDWFGTNVEIVALATGPFKFNSAPTVIAVPTRPVAPTITADSATRAGVADGALVGTTVAMEYKLVTAPSNAWIRASAGETTVAAGQYEVRVAAVDFASFAGVATRVTVHNKVSVADIAKVIVGDDDVALITPVKVLSAVFTAGPNPVSKSAGNVAFFWQGKAIAKSTLSVFDVQGNLVRKITVSDNGTGNIERRAVGSWDLIDRKGRSVSEGTYLIRGTVNTRDGGKERVSYKIGVR